MDRPQQKPERKGRKECSDAEFFHGRTLLHSPAEIEREIQRAFPGRGLCIGYWRNVDVKTGRVVLDFVVKEARVDG